MTCLKNLTNIIVAPYKTPLHDKINFNYGQHNTQRPREIRTNQTSYNAMKYNKIEYNRLNKIQHEGDHQIKGTTM